MAEQQQDQDRSEAATPFKLEEARKRGSVAKSMDVNSVLVLGTAAFMLHFSGSQIVSSQLALYRSMLSNADARSFALGDLSSYFGQLLVEMLLSLLPVLLPVVVIAALGNFLQTGPVFSFFPLKPDLDRVNPVSGFKRLFSMRLLVEGVKTVLKMLLLGAVLYAAISSSLPAFLRSLSVAPVSVGRIILPELGDLLFRMTAALLVVALIDAVYSRWDFARRMRMSRRDVRDEVKRREGDPRVKSRVRELQREALKRAASLGRVKDADVLITNPVHLAVAVRYDRDTLDAPRVIAKGAGFLAARMRLMARRHGVPVVENRRLARALFHGVAIDRPVPPEQYSAVARVLVWVYSMRRPAPGVPA
ncbi:MAG: EscU/YscU/HrcU family type III secretion system export apparatus switch protein [Methyloversatilis sp.]|nr:EscU/YscU/HrcU family type III secretion system export apparatus switch protein [Methyloversatilis sp.]